MLIKNFFISKIFIAIFLLMLTFVGLSNKTCLGGITTEQRYEKADTNEALSAYGHIVQFSDSIIKLVDDYRMLPKTSKDIDSVFCNTLLKHIQNIQKYLDKEVNERNLEISQKASQIDELHFEKYRIAKIFLIAISILSVVLLILIYSRYRIIVISKNKLEEKQEELSKINERLLQSQNSLKKTNANKDKFFSIISHDLRNPFAAIASFSRLIKRDIDSLSKSELHELANELDKSVSKILNLLDNLLVWSRSQTGKTIFQPQQLNLVDIINDNIELLTANAKEKDIKINHKFDESLFVFGDKNMLDAIMRNLISNAIKYSNAGGEVNISISTADNKAVISVADKGIGIAEEDKDKIFDQELFYSTYGTSDEKGSGLGLIITKEFVEKHGGEISFESKAGEGSTFTFSFPLDKDAMDSQGAQ